MVENFKGEMAEQIGGVNLLYFTITQRTNG